ncbi:MAG: hypothetical protein F4060_15265 [Holophagales bacterium]|nr:hypothetical protein [Holophagales bacterium]MYG30843.1 hypothetical protein [Holophagales bacterium]MYI81290.1 hypothetical protein [Holophagales bacterium]
MKQIIPVAFIAGAVPALLTGQTVIVDCPEEHCQVAPYFAGDGGFVGESAGIDGEDEVSFIVICGNATVTSSVQPDSNGIVRQALNNSNGLNCREGTSGTLEIDNLKPGGWYWINDDQNSAVSALIPKDAVGNEKITVTDPGGVTIDSPRDGAAAYVTHAPTGRVGIIPRVVPTRPIPGCSGRVDSDTAVDCHLGSPEGWRLTASPSSVVRPQAGQQTRTVTVTLHGENFVTTADSVFGRGAIDHHLSVLGILFNTTTGVAPPQGQAGLLEWEVEVAPDDDRCLPANNDPDRGNAQTITFTLAELEGVIPDAPNDTVETTFSVNCPASSAASQGAELVPENPFPVDE